MFQIWKSADHWWMFCMYSLWLVWYLCTVVLPSLQMRQKIKPVVLRSVCDMKKVLAWLQPSYGHPLSSRKIRQECVCVSLTCMIFLLVRIIHALKTFHWHDTWKQQRKILSAHDHYMIQLMTFPMFTGKNRLLRELFCHHKILATIC